jgi:hypothetical protein
MHTVVRSYTGKGAKAFFDLLEKHQAEVREVMGKVQGLLSYQAVRTADGGFTITVCRDEAGTADSVARARRWVAENASQTGVTPPTVLEGVVMVELK